LSGGVIPKTGFELLKDIVPSSLFAHISSDLIDRQR
jgi:hypothetical protein